MDFVVVVLSIILPVVIFLIGLARYRKTQKIEVLNNLLRRVGLEKQQQNRITFLLNDYKENKLFTKLITMLKKAGINSNKQYVWLAVIQASLIVIPTIIWVVFDGSMETKIKLLTVVMPFLPLVFVFVKVKKRQATMEKQFPEMLDGIVRALHSGFGTDAALSMIAEEFPAPLGQEMKEVNRQLTLSVSFRDVMREFQKRVDLQESQFFVVVLIIQRETGGQLAKILDELSMIMRRRENFVAKLRTNTAESRFTATFIGGAPILYILYKYLFDRESLTFFLSDPVGQKLFIVSLVLIITGTIILKSMLKMRF